jgi:hypothetical protein
MAYTVVKTIKGKKYLYRQSSKRVGKKVKTMSTYLGPVANTLAGILTFGGYLAKHGIEPTPHHKAKSYEKRSEKIAAKDIRAVDRKYGVDKSDRDAFHASLSRLSPEMRREHFREQLAVGAKLQAEKDQAGHLTEADKNFDATVMDAVGTGPGTSR